MITCVVMARLDEELAGFVYVGITNGAGAVKVGRRVDVGNTWNAATNVGFGVGDFTGAGVGGGSTIGRMPPVDRLTFAAYTQPLPRGASENSIWIHSPAGLRPMAGAVPPTGICPTVG